MKLKMNLTNLVEIARNRSHDGSGITYSSWRAVNHGLNGYVEIFHYSTLMIIVNDDDTVRAVSPGWGSMSDKQGIRKVLANVSGQSYSDVFGS